LSSAFGFNDWGNAPPSAQAPQTANTRLPSLLNIAKKPEKGKESRGFTFNHGQDGQKKKRMKIPQGIFALLRRGGNYGILLKVFINFMEELIEKNHNRSLLCADGGGYGVRRRQKRRFRRKRRGRRG
jgi:hypothetical protein